jgi:hypothetical protein
MILLLLAHQHNILSVGAAIFLFSNLLGGSEQAGSSLYSRRPQPVSGTLNVITAHHCTLLMWVLAVFELF